MIRSTALLAAALLWLPGSVPAGAVLPVEIVTAAKAPVSRMHVLVGTVEAANSHGAAFRTGGRITDIAAEIGDSVKAGDVIARVDGTQAEAAAEAARAALRAAEAALRQAVQAQDRAELLLERGVGTRAGLDEARQTYETALSARDQARAQLSRARQAVADTVLKALADSIVIDRMADIGEVAGPGQPVFTLANDGRLDAVFQAPDLGGLAAFRGQAFVLSAPGSDTEFNATVTEVSPVVGKAGTVEIRASIEDAALGVLGIGNIVEGRLTVEGAPVVQVPWTALTGTADGPAVWVVDPQSGTVAIRQVTIASYTDRAIALAGGVAEGEQVVGAGSQDLYEGRKVEAAVETAEIGR